MALVLGIFQSQHRASQFDNNFDLITLPSYLNLSQSRPVALLQNQHHPARTAT